MEHKTLEVLRRLPLFAELGEDALREVAERTVLRRYARDRTIFRRGEPCQGLHVVVEGQVKVYRASPDGREQVLHTEGPGEPLAEIPLFDGGPYPASARATEDSRLLFLPLDAFQRLYRTNPEIADAVIRNLGQRLRKMVALVDRVSLKDVHARVAASLLEYAENAGQAVDGGEFALPRTQEEMAGELATTRESVARALGRLRREKTIEQKGAWVRILDLARLARAASGGRVKEEG